MSTDALFTLERTITVLLPEIVLIVSAVAMITVGAFVKAPRWVWSGASVVALLVALGALYALRATSTDLITYGAVALNDALSIYSRLGLLLSGLILVALAHNQVEARRAPEFFGAILLIHAGTMLVAGTNEMVLLFAGLELISIPTYLLLYLPERNPSTQEAATKYFYLSIFSSALLLFGLAYLYGMTGISNLKALSYVLHQISGVDELRPPLAFGLIALLFVMAGLGFRVAAVPFHFYAPDVYQGSPTVVAALLSWLPKAVGFLAMLRVLTAVMAGTGELADKAIMLSFIIAVASMTLGNTVALLQDDLKRLLAYSSIAHAGYLMIGIAVAFRDVPGAVGTTLGAQAIIFYLAAYALMTLGVFGVMVALSTPGRPVETVDDLAGLGRTQPLAALAMAICLFSLAGVPPLAGFWGKLFLFTSALSVGGEHARLFTWLAILGVINAAIGAYYYLRIVVIMYLRAPDPHARPIEARAPWATRLAVGACAALSVLIGLYAEPVNMASREAAVAAVTLPNPVMATGEPGTDSIPRVAAAPTAP